MSYRNKQNELIDFATWQGLRASEEIFSSVVNYGEYQISINRKYFGTEGSVFKVWVECSSDLPQYHKYIKHFEGENEAITEFERIVSAINEDQEIFDKSKENGMIQLIYDVRYNQHIVCDMRNYPEIDYCYNLRSEAEIKYTELIGG